MNTESLETLITKDGRKVLTCEYDADPLEPDLPDMFTEVHFADRSNFEDLVTKVCFNGDYDAYEKAIAGTESTKECFERLENALVSTMQWITPISKYEHSAVNYSAGVSKGWDSGVAGFAIYKVKEAIEKLGHPEWDNKTQWLDQCIKPYLVDYSAYTNGDIYVISYRNAETDEVEESVGSCIFDDSKSMTENMFAYTDIADSEYKDPESWVEAKQETIIKHKYEAI